jgi:hypothetical protein
LDWNEGENEVVFLTNRWFILSIDKEEAKAKEA